MKKFRLLFAIIGLVFFIGYGCTPREETQQPVADFNFIPSSGIKTGDDVNFTNSSTDAETYDWDFKDGSKSVAQHPTHQFTTAGTFNVTLVVTNKNLRDEISKNVIVENSVTACFTFSPATANVEDPVSFTNCSEGADSYEWHLGGDNTILSTLADPIITFHAAGTYEIKLIAKAGSSTDEVVHSITIEAGNSVSACFTMSTNQAAMEDPVYFTNCSTGANSYEWYLVGYPDIISVEKDPVFYFHADGTYDIKLVAKSGSLTDEVVHSITIGIIDPSCYSCVPYGEAIYYTGFDVSGTGEWLEDSGATWSASISGGLYTLTDNDASATNYGRMYWTNTAQPSTGNWELETYMSNTIDNEAYGSGLMFGLDPSVGSNRFKFSVNAYLISVYGNSTGWVSTSSGYARDFNKLTVRFYDGIYYFFLNEVLLYSDTAYDYGYQFGFTIDQDTQVDIDWVGIWPITGSKKSIDRIVVSTVKKDGKSRQFTKSSKSSNSGKSMWMPNNDLLKK